MTELTASNGEPVTVTASAGKVEVTWACGGYRCFSPGGLAETIDYLELVSELGDDVWLTHRDKEGVPFSLRVAGGRCYADDQPSDEAEYVGWSAFKTALQDAKRSKAVTRPKAGRFRRAWRRLRRVA